MKKYYGVIIKILCLAFMLNLCPWTVGAESGAENEKALSFLKNIGGFAEVDCSPNEWLTRGEFTSVIANACRFNQSTEESSNWNNEVYGEDNNNTVITENGRGNLFNDVDETYPYYESIRAMYNRGFIKGISKDLFAPDLGVSILNVSKVLLDMMGYEKYAIVAGGYPTGYEQVSEELGLTRGIKKAFTDVATQNDLAVMIYNILDTEVLTVTEVTSDGVSYGPKENKTFLNSVLKLDKISGVLTDNGVAGIYSADVKSKDVIVVNDKEIKMTENTAYARNYLGRHINAYTANNTDDGELIYAELSGKDQTFIFDIDDFGEFSMTHIKYFNDRKSISKKLASNVCMIYNGTYKGMFDSKTFDFEKGKVQLIAFNGSNEINLIIVDSYEYMYVKRVNQAEKIIYGSYVNKDVSDKIDLSDDDTYAEIYDESGNATELESIAAGQVLKFEQSGSVIKINVINRKIENFNIKSIEEDEGKKYITSENEKYELYSKFDSSVYSENIKTGGTYNIYLGEDNIAIWLQSESVDEKQAAYLIRCWADDLDEEAIFVRMFGFDGSTDTYELSEKVRVYAKDGKKYSKTSSKVYADYLNGFNGMIKYGKDDENKINYIEFPTDERNSDGQLYKLFETFDDSQSEFNYEKYPWVGEGTVGRRINLASDTKYIKIPLDLKDESKYLVSNVRYFVSSNVRPFIAYASKPNTSVAEYMVFKSTSNDQDIIGTGREFVVVEKITQESKDDENVQKISGMLVSKNGIKNVELYSKMDAAEDADGNPCSIFEAVTDTMRSKENGKLKLYSVKKGDIIRCIYDEYNYVSIADLTYRPTLENPNFPESKCGFLLGSNGLKYSSSAKNSNPYNLEPNGTLSDLVGCKIAYGWVVRCEDENILQTTTRDLSVGISDLDNIDPEKFVNETYKMIGNVLTVDYSKNKVSVKEGSMNDIKTYEEAGSNCSRVLYSSYYDTQMTTIIINGQFY